MTTSQGPRPSYETAVDRISAQTAAPLSDAALARVLHQVEKKVARPAPASERGLGWRWLAAGAFASAAAAMVVWFVVGSQGAVQLEPAVAFSVVRQSGEVQWSRGVAPWQAAIGQANSEDPQVTLAADAQLWLEGDGARWIAVGPARLKLQAKQPPTLNDGVLALAVARRRPNAPFVVHVGDAQVTVHGTRFSVEAAHGVLVSVQVAEGTVTVTTPQEPLGQRLGPGDTWGKSQASAVHQRALEGTLGASVNGVARFAELYLTSTPTGAHVMLAGESVGVTPLWLRGLTGRASVVLDAPGYASWHEEVPELKQGRQTLHATMSALAPAAVVEPEPPARSVSRRLPVFVAAERWFAKRDCPAVRKALKNELAATAATDDRARAWLLLGECYVRTAKRREALAAYDQVVAVAPTDSTGATATFEGAKLCSELGRDREALDRFERFLANYPASALRDAAAFRRCELLVKLKNHREARECLVAHRRDFPTSTRVRDAALMAASLACLDQDAAGLRAELERYLSLGVGGSDDSDTFYPLARCLSRTPHAANRTIVERYLQRLPHSRHQAELQTLLGELQ